MTLSRDVTHRSDAFASVIRQASKDLFEGLLPELEVSHDDDETGAVCCGNLGQLKPTLGAGTHDMCCVTFESLNFR